MCVGCLWIAAKMEEKEVDIPTLTYLIEVTGITRADSAVSHELRSMETIILQAAEWNGTCRRFFLNTSTLCVCLCCSGPIRNVIVLLSLLSSIDF